MNPTISKKIINNDWNEPHELPKEKQASILLMCSCKRNSKVSVCLLNYFILFSLLFFHKLQGEDERKQIKKWRQRHIKALMTTLLVSLEKSWQVESNNTKKYYKHWMELTTRVFKKYLDSLFFMVLTESTLITNKNLFYIIKFILSKFFQ